MLRPQSMESHQRDTAFICQIIVACLEPDHLLLTPHQSLRLTRSQGAGVLEFFEAAKMGSSTSDLLKV